MPVVEPSELVAPPAVGRTYGERVRARVDDTGPTRRVRLDALARWLQDAAYWDLVDAGWPTPSPWFVRRLRLQVQRFPAFAEAVELRTWCSGLGPAVAERRTSLTGEHGARVEAVALWVHLDPVAQRPLGLAQRFHEVYGPSAGDRRSRTRLRHPPLPDAPEPARRFAFRATDLDPAGHVNNAAYWAVLEEELADHPATVGLDVELEHRAPSVAGPVDVLADGDLRWVRTPDGTVAASAAFVASEGVGAPASRR